MGRLDDIDLKVNRPCGAGCPSSRPRRTSCGGRWPASRPPSATRTGKSAGFSRSCAFALLLALTAGCSMIDRMSGVSDTKALQESGVAAQAVILRIWDTGITVNDDPVIGMEVEVRPADGEPWRATLPKSLISRLDIPRFQPGQSVQIRFDPQDRSRVGLDEYRYR